MAYLSERVAGFLSYLGPGAAQDAGVQSFAEGERDVLPRPPTARIHKGTEQVERGADSLLGGHVVARRNIRKP